MTWTAEERARDAADWDAIEDNFDTQVERRTAVMLAERFSEAWLDEARAAEAALAAAVLRLEHARRMMNETTDVLELACRLYSMGRT